MKPHYKKFLVIGAVLVFLLGWLSFASYLYLNQILVIDIQGTITDFEWTTLALYKAKMNSNVKAVILYLNTPGGLAYPCLEIASYVKALAEVKPVIAVMGAHCASGGYYIASFTNYIFTREYTITGGIGVISVWVDLSGYYEKERIKIWIWKTGEEKDLGAEWRSPTAEENATIQETVNELFIKLLTDITNNRNLTEKAVNETMSGTTFIGTEAVNIGLADEVGNIVNAQEKAVEMSGIWRFIIVTHDMTNVQRFLEAMF